MFAQTLQEALTLNEIISLKRQVWWTGCTETPYLCRGGVYSKNSYLLGTSIQSIILIISMNMHVQMVLLPQYNKVITDTRNVWITKADQNQIIEEKDKFNQSIKIKFEDILKTLDSPLRFGRSSTQFTRLQFRKNREEDLIFIMEFQVGIYPFKWEFFLTKMDDNEIFNILVDDLLNPMAKTIISLEQRGNAYKQKCIQIENELVKRLSEKERASYFTSVDKDNEEFWTGFLKVDPPSDKLTNFDFGPAAKYFFSKYNSSQLIEEIENQRNLQNNQQIQNEGHNNDEEYKRMKLIQDYFSTLDEQPLGNPILRPDSKKRYQKNGSEEEIPVLKQQAQQKLANDELIIKGIKVNYEEQNEEQKMNQQPQKNDQQEDKKRKKRLDFL